MSIRASAEENGSVWCTSLAGHLYGPRVVHKLDPQHVNHAIRSVFSGFGEAAELFELLYAGNIDGLVAGIECRIARSASGCRLRTAILEKHRYESGCEMVLSVGKGYEPQSGHLMLFSTHQPFCVILDPSN